MKLLLNYIDKQQMAISGNKFVRAVTPRAFEHWGRNMGIGVRAEIQLAQYAKYPLIALQGTNQAFAGNTSLVLENAMMRLEARISRLQEDPFKFTPELNRAIEDTRRRTNIAFLSLAGFSAAFRFAEMVSYEQLEPSLLSLFRLLAPPAAILTIGHFTKVAQVRKESARIDMEIAQEALRASEIKFQDLFEYAPIGFHTINKEGNILDVNQTWLEMLGYARKSEVVGQSIFNFIVPEQRESARARFLARINEQSIPEKEEDRIYLKKEGTHVIIETRDTLRTDGEGNITGVQTSFQDITERRQAEAELVRAHESMVKQAKEAAIGHLAKAVSHALKNRFLTIAGQMEIAKKIGLEFRVLLDILYSYQRTGRQIDEASIRNLIERYDNAAGLLAQFEDSFHMMDKITRSMLSVSRETSGLINTIGVEEQIERVMPALNEIARVRKASLIFDLDDIGMSDGIRMGEAEFQDIIMNLVINAIEAGSSRITVQVKRNKDNIVIIVQDDGKGISLARVNQLLDRPIQSDKPGGTGLGLYTVNRMVQNVGGIVGIDSTVGEGTTIRIELPRQHYVVKSAEEAAAVVDAISEDVASTITIMLVEDEEQNLFLLNRRLTDLGFKVVEFANPEEAYNAMAEVRPNIILTDEWMFPHISGHELIERIAGEYSQGLPRFILHSGDPFPADKDDPMGRVISEHDVAYVQKGADFTSLDRTVISIANKVLADNGGLEHQEASATRENILDIPMVVFLGRIAHKVNNSLLGISGYLELAFMRDPINLGHIAAAKSSFNELSEFLRSLEQFSKIGEIIGEVRLEKTGLPEAIADDEMAITNWLEMSADDRHRLAALIDVYLNSGWFDFLLEVDQLLNDNLDRTTYQNMVKPWLGRVQDINHGVQLSAGKPTESDRFRNIYRLLKDI